MARKGEGASVSNLILLVRRGRRQKVDDVPRETQNFKAKNVPRETF